LFIYRLFQDEKMQQLACNQQTKHSSLTFVPCFMDSDSDEGRFVFIRCPQQYHRTNRIRNVYRKRELFCSIVESRFELCTIDRFTRKLLFNARDLSSLTILRILRFLFSIIASRDKPRRPRHWHWMLATRTCSFHHSVAMSVKFIDISFSYGLNYTHAKKSCKRLSFVP